jgi:hypothetical protein
MEHISDLNFSIIGVAKSGTTALAKWLSMHPEICMSQPKETNFFVKNSIKAISDNDPLKEHIINSSRLSEEQFLASFYSCDKEFPRVYGEASVHNFMYLDEFISSVSRKVKIIILVRDPVPRALSNFNYLSHLLDMDFNEYIEKYDLRKPEEEWGEFWNFFEQGRTEKKIKILKKSFDNILVLNYEDLKDNPYDVLLKCEQFLGVDTFRGYKTERINVTRIPNKMHVWTRRLPFRKYLTRADFPFKKWLIDKLLRKSPSNHVKPENIEILAKYYSENG